MPHYAVCFLPGEEMGVETLRSLSLQQGADVDGPTNENAEYVDPPTWTLYAFCRPMIQTSTRITKLALLNFTASKGQAETSHLLLQVVYGADTDPKGYGGRTSGSLHPMSCCGRFNELSPQPRLGPQTTSRVLCISYRPIESSRLPTSGFHALSLLTYTTAAKRLLGGQQAAGTTKFCGPSFLAQMWTPPTTSARLGHHSTGHEKGIMILRTSHL